MPASAAPTPPAQPWEATHQSPSAAPRPPAGAAAPGNQGPPKEKRRQIPPPPSFGAEHPRLGGPQAAAEGGEERGKTRRQR